MIVLPESVAARYMEPHRFYHNLQHIYFGLSVGFRYFSSYMDETLLAAWWYHDAIYELGARDNEEKSALLAKRDGHSYDVQQLIRCTIYPNPKEPKSGAEAVINDMDLAGFATPQKVYDNNTALIRKEYPNLSDEEFAAGHRAFLRKLITEQPQLYKSDFAHKNWTAQAMKNILRDILD